MAFLATLIVGVTRMPSDFSPSNIVTAGRRAVVAALL
jgi:hypothetical protein